MLTKQGLEASLYVALEFGYRACEKGHNLEKAMSDAEPSFAALIEKSGLRAEIIRIRSRKE